MLWVFVDPISTVDQTVESCVLPVQDPSHCVKFIIADGQFVNLHQVVLPEELVVQHSDSHEIRVTLK